MYDTLRRSLQKRKTGCGGLKIVDGRGDYMRVKIKGFESGKSYNIYNEQKNVVLDMYVFFSKKNYVLVSYYNRDNVEKKYAASKRYFKEFLRLPFPIIIEEMDNKDFFLEYYNRYDDYIQDDWSELYACENGCCSCCGCSCNDHLYYDYDYYEDEVGSATERL
jgi:hypothetical protein